MVVTSVAITYLLGNFLAQSRRASKKPCSSNH